MDSSNINEEKKYGGQLWKGGLIAWTETLRDRSYDGGSVSSPHLDPLQNYSEFSLLFGL